MDKIKYFLKCNEEIWDYIKPIVSKYNYIYSTPTLSPNWEKYPYLTYEYDGIIGILSNTETISENDKIVGIAEFIDIIKNKNNHIKGIPLKPGMQIETNDNYVYIVFPIKYNKFAVILHGSDYWDTVDNFLNTLNSNHFITKIYDITDDTVLCNGKILWDITNI